MRRPRVTNRLAGIQANTSHSDRRCNVIWPLYKRIEKSGPVLLLNLNKSSFQPTLIWQLTRIARIMGKKNKEKDVDQVPNPNNVSNRDIIQRLNFLYQASVYLNSVGVPRPSTPAAPGDADTEKMGCVESGKQEKHKRKKRRKEVVNTSDLSRIYIRTMKIVGQKTTVKMCVFFLLSLHDS